LSSFLIFGVLLWVCRYLATLWYTRSKTVTHLSTNRARRVLTSRSDHATNAANHHATPRRQQQLVDLARQWRFHAGAGVVVVGGTAPQSVARLPDLAVLLTHCGQLILRKISKFDTTRCQILRLKYTAAVASAF